MRKIMILVVSFSAAAVGIAYAAETTGTVSGVNTKSDSITLSDGKAYVLPEGIEAESVKVGQRIKLKFSEKNGRNQVSSLVRLK